jgi:NitT/TauT family transport system substrate-binding protein
VLNRRQLIASAPLLAMSASASLLAMPAIVRAQGKKPVTFTLPWVAEGSNLVAYVAKGKGYWADAGLDVTVTRGYGSVAAAQAVGAGRFDFGLAAASAGIQQVAKGLPVVAISCSGYDATMGVGVLSDSPIRTPQQLAGKTLGCAPASGEYPFLPAYFRKVGVDPASVKIQFTDPNVRTRVLIEKQVDVISGFAISVLPTTVASNIPLRFMLYSAVGLRQYNNMLLTTAKRLHDDPETCKAIVSGLERANLDIIRDPDAAVDLFLQQVPEMALAANGKRVVQVGLGIYLWNLIDPGSMANGIGYSDPAAYQTMIDMVMQYASSPGDKTPTVAEVMTNDLIGSLKPTDAEWTAAKKKAAPFGEYLS